MFGILSKKHSYRTNKWCKVFHLFCCSCLQRFWGEQPHFLRPVQGRYTFANMDALGIDNTLCAWVRPAVSYADIWRGVADTSVPIGTAL